jgi:hypothetical protein
MEHIGTHIVPDNSTEYVFTYSTAQNINLLNLLLDE